MKPIIIDMNEMSDSKEVYDSRPNRTLPMFLYTCLALFAVAIVWMCVGTIEVTVKANGMLRPSVENGYTCLVYVENKDVGKVVPGMPVKLNVHAYPNTEYGYLRGTLEKIADDITVDATTGVAYYQAEVSVDSDAFVDERGKKIPLKAGMACQVKLVTKEQRIGSFVLDKLQFLAVK